MRAILCGYGEIGRAVKEVFGRVHDIDVCDPANKLFAAPKHYDIMLVAFPYGRGFENALDGYQNDYTPVSTIVFSTTAIGTCSKFPNTVHVPVEGRHPDLAESLRLWPKFMGGVDEAARLFIEAAGCHVVQLLQPEHTEFLKLRSTTTYGINLEWARESKRISDDIGMDYGWCNTWDEAYNELYHHFGMEWATRPILQPPNGEIGGHCVVPNARILVEQYPSPMVREVAKQNHTTVTTAIRENTAYDDYRLAVDDYEEPREDVCDD